ncbi:RtcB family protein [Xenorhabdus sp. IM139775]|uniref:RtcB family protein n=1 Tax=Xenorhabdus sp. IM139775 TaxID=3025876 RepID=UPI002359E38F|nr:RtcB family protein [Xenorhabdus sp. IM139775]MDC9594411.1 RtcB family protein [Xenorhabdus sp. IM139775]
MTPLFVSIAQTDRHSVKGIHQVGTLGTGNHFIELCPDEADRVWVYSVNSITVKTFW